MVKTIVGIDGMMCGMCESHVNDVIRKSFDVKKEPKYARLCTGDVLTPFGQNCKPSSKLFFI